MQAQPRSRPGAQARPGDVTGRKREELSKQHAEEVAAREGEIAMVNAEKQRSLSDDVIDPITREIISFDGSVTKMDVEEDETPRLLSTSTTGTVEELPEPNRATGPNGVPLRGGVDPDEKVIIRVNADLEEVTLGYGNTVSFVQGGRYRVSRWVADHLEEKGLVWH